MIRYRVLVFLLWPALLGAQSKLDISAGFISAFNSGKPSLWGHPVDERLTTGYEARAGYSYPFKEVPVEPVVRIGYKQLFFAGTYESSAFSGSTHKFLVTMGGRYRFNPKWAAGIYLNTENNRDLADFRTQTSDNFRYSASLEVNRLLGNGLGIYAAYGYAWYPRLDRYLIFNPAHQLSLGLNYRIL